MNAFFILDLPLIENEYDLCIRLLTICHRRKFVKTLNCGNCGEGKCRRDLCVESSEMRLHEANGMNGERSYTVDRLGAYS